MAAPQLQGALLSLLMLLLVQSGRGLAEEESQSVLMGMLEQYGQFVQLLEEADVLGSLELELRSAEQLTMFAPTDDYLSERVPPTLMNFLRAPGNQRHLKRAVLCHVASGKVDALAWLQRPKVVTLGGCMVDLSVVNDTFMINNVAIVDFASVRAVDGLVHGISGLFTLDEVRRTEERAGFQDVNYDGETRRMALEVGSVADAPAPAPSAPVPPVEPTEPDNITLIIDSLVDYPNFVALLEEFGVLDEIRAGLEVETQYTIFAVTDEAIKNNSQFLSSDDRLQEIARYHVLNNTLADSEVLRQLQGGEFPVFPTLAEGQMVNVTTFADKVYVNGVFVDAEDIEDRRVSDYVAIHGLKGMLIPPSISNPAVPPPPPVSPPPASPPPPPSAGPSNSRLSFSLAALVVLLTAAILF